ncbi:MAG: hypothetical protein Q7U98_20170 [Methylicorpusculum sp.]|uniref:hypothetical protein n=1 Tax=Methylicorpusculum sp. TaxID=2713644 RepID=UPI00271E90A3|nr:hypothetical protein [Methylicorpusculum sp.]MDO8941481.1 hypothetical protein [Methylicorpusculum sp.]MDP2202261.1 hypothetical protein [Methylicorpusculum sp.]
MQITPHDAAAYGDAIRALLPPGAAWDWPVGSQGRLLLAATGEELARVEAETQKVLDRAVFIHRPGTVNWHIDAYRSVANQAVADSAETIPRTPARVGSTVGVRLWHAEAVFTVSRVQVDHLVGPLRVGSHVGDRGWGSRGRYVLRVRYYRSVVDPYLLWQALNAFKQAHVFLWFEDISAAGGEVSYAQD